MSEEALAHRKIKPEVLARLSGLELRARLVVEGYFAGLHRSPYHGLSAEYADHRQYVQGDDLRHIDWKVFGRTDKHYIKEYEQETNLQCVLLVDASESMAFRSSRSPLSKYDYACILAAAIAHLALRQRDAVGLALFDERLGPLMAPSTSPARWKDLVHRLEQPPGGAKTSIGHVLDELAERLVNRSLVIVVSDLFDAPLGILRGLRHLKYRRHDVIVCNIWDNQELTLSLKGSTLFEGYEGLGRLLAEPRSLQAAYLAEVAAFQAALRRGCSQMHMDYVLFDTLASMDAALSAYLAMRASRIRQRSSRVLGAG